VAIHFREVAQIEFGRVGLELGTNIVRIRMKLGGNWCIGRLVVGLVWGGIGIGCGWVSNLRMLGNWIGNWRVIVRVRRVVMNWVGIRMEWVGDLWRRWRMWIGWRSWGMAGYEY
jgi:hypothetical protein